MKIVQHEKKARNTRKQEYILFFIVVNQEMICVFLWNKRKRKKNEMK